MDRLRIGVIGLGWFGEIHCEAIIGVPNLELAALCTRTPERLAALGRKFGVERTYQDYRRLVTDPGIDAVSIVTMWDQHTEPAIAALVHEHETNSDKPILVLEGSALMPEETLGLISKTVAAVWLTGSDAFLRKRIESESHYGSLDIAGRYLVDQFIERNRRLDQMNRDDAQRLGLPTVIVDGFSIDEVAAACLRAVADPPLPLR